MHRAVDEMQAGWGTVMYDGVAVGLSLLTDRLAAQEASGETITSLFNLTA